MKPHNLKKSWQQEKEKSNYFWLQIILWLANNLGRPLTRLFLLPITLYYMLFSRSIRHSSKNYWLIFDKKYSILRSFKQIFYFSATILDRVYFLQDKFNLFNIETCGVQQALDLIKKNKSCIFLGSHLGSFDILRSMSTGDKIPISLKISMDENHNEKMTTMLNVINSNISKMIIKSSNSLENIFIMKKLLDESVNIAFLNDRIISKTDKNYQTKFLGNKCYFPTKNIKLAIALKKPVIFFVAVYAGDNNYKIFFIPLLLTGEQQKLPKTKKIKLLCSLYVQELEQKVKEYPYNWFNFYDFWH
ncbi:MAG: hypothetical protein DRQ51_08945 [Gammaproteobacteria bacterium]|nr:MAG: hypothetical protein DRQ51_08945 [Gammaproteobacteria bacterium]